MILFHLTAYATEPTCTGIDWRDDRPYRQYVCYPCRVTHRVRDRGTQCDTSVAPAQTFSHFPEGKALNHIKAHALYNSNCKKISYRPYIIEIFSQLQQHF